MVTPELLLALLISVCILAMLAERLRLSAPIIFTLGGVAIGFLPGFPHLAIPPEWILIVFLPPLLMEAAYYTSLRDFRANLRPILQLAIGCVIATTVAVAFATEWIAPEMGLALGFVLGAIISPPDAVAAISTVRSLRVPKRITTILEGESLVNDATGLVLYGFAVAAVVTGSFSAPMAILQFVWKVGSGILIGISVALVYMRVFRYIRVTSTEILSTFLVPYLVYLIADGVQSSGVIAVVAAGLTVGWMSPEIFTPRFRLPAESVWRVVVFMLNGIVFLLIGLQFPGLLDRLPADRLDNYLGYALGICAATTLIRFVWVYALTYGTRVFMPSVLRKDPYPPWQNVFIIAWTGMRGVVSLATALALPLTLANGEPFPYRDLLIFLATVVIIFTLVFQGLTLPWLLKRLDLGYNPALLLEDWHARHQITRRALQALDELKERPDMQAPALQRVFGFYQDRLESLGDGPNTPLHLAEAPPSDLHPLVAAENRIWQHVIAAERQAIVEMRKAYQISDDLMHNLLREMDLLATRFN